MGELGQVFTSQNVARVMAELLLGDASRTPRAVLDPCIGPNTFLKEIASHAPDIELYGIEIDSSLVDASTKKFYDHPHRHLQLANFFDFASRSSQKFDGIIQNPPYVRHEKMIGDNDKVRIRSFFADAPYTIPASSNLYVYFLLRSIDLLAPEGKLVAIVYDSWLHSKYGEQFKSTLMSRGSIESIIHFKDGAFEDAGVGATIIEFTKGSAQKANIRFAAYDNARTLSKLKNIRWTTLPLSDVATRPAIQSHHTDQFVPITTIADINRGTSALNNKLFVFKERQFQETIPFLKNVKDITHMSAMGDKHLLVARESRRSETHAYLEKIKTLILSNKEKYHTLSKKVATEELWYSPRLAQPGDIIFNYYLRDTIDFLLNQKRLQSSDNFYNLRIHSHIYAHFALLNSTMVRQEVLRHSRTQGSGLRKIQLYEFKRVMVPNIERFSVAHVAQLEGLGKKLSKQMRGSEQKHCIVSEIDHVIEQALAPSPKISSIDYTVIQYGQALV